MTPYSRAAEAAISLPREQAADSLIAPYGGSLTALMVHGQIASELKAQSRDFASCDLTPRQVCDLELLLNGGFSPLTGFLTRADYDSVCSSMRLADGTLWPIPITLNVPPTMAASLKPHDRVALRDAEGVMLAVLRVEDVWQPDGAPHCCIGGEVSGVQLPLHYDFRSRRMTPAALRTELRRLGWRRVISVQAGKPMHKAEYESISRAARAAGAKLLIQPLVDASANDFTYFSNIRCHEALLRRFPAGLAQLVLLPMAVRSAGPREALLHAIVAKNYGCTHVMIAGEEEEPAQIAHALLERHEQEIGVRKIPFHVETRSFDASELRARLAVGLDIPEWFTFPEIADELRRQFPARARQGCTIFFTGLSGSGKSTVANVLRMRLLEAGARRPVTVLDGDLVRRHLSSELGFSKEHRDLNIRRIGFVASEITKNGGFAICAPIAPYDAVRKDVREMVAAVGGFVLVHVATPLDVCEARDRKGLYAKARAGIVKEFTGISDSYEAPEDADVVIDTTSTSAEDATDRILAHLVREGYLE